MTEQTDKTELAAQVLRPLLCPSSICEVSLRNGWPQIHFQHDQTDAESSLWIDSTWRLEPAPSLPDGLTVPQTIMILLGEIAGARVEDVRCTVHHPRHPVPPAELLHFIVRGLAKDPSDRYQSAAEMISELVRIRDGRCRVSCPATLARRMLGTASAFVGRYPKLSPFVFYAVLLGLLCCVVTTARVLAGALGP